MMQQMQRAFFGRLRKARPAVATVTPRKPVRSDGDIVSPGPPYTVTGYLWHEPLGNSSSQEQSGAWGDRPVTTGWSIEIASGWQTIHAGNESGDWLTVVGYGRFQALAITPLDTPTSPGNTGVIVRLRKLD